MKSGIDIASILKQSDENADKDAMDIADTTEIGRKSSTSSLKREKNFTDVDVDMDNQNKSSEKSELVNELEVSSKEMVKESVLLSYFKSANRPCMLAALIISILLSQTLVSLADIWISYW